MSNKINSKFIQEHEKIEKSAVVTKATLLIETTSQSEREILKEAALENNLPYKWFIETIKKDEEYKGFLWKTD